MIKSNIRLPTTSLSLLSKRNSMLVLDKFNTSTGNNQSPLSQSSGFSSTSTSQARKDSILSGLDHQHRSSSLAVSRIANTSSKVEQVPEIKPRTSILKNRGLKNNANDVAKSDSQLQQKFKSSSSSSSSIMNKPTTKLAATTTAAAQAKPKSILKSSKSVSNISSIELDSSSSQQTHQVQANNTQTQSKSSNIPSLTLTSMKRDDIDDKRYSMMDNENIKASGEAMQSFKLNEIDEDEEYAARERSLERLKLQRASCYDISRLMSKNGLQSQLNKLRSGSTSSIASRSRQRRPALLINDTEKDELETETPRTTTQTDDNEAKIRVKVSPTQVRLSRPQSITDLTSLNEGRKVDNSKIYNQENEGGMVNKIESLTREQQSKKSEFDPRSLRRLPVKASVKVVASNDTLKTERRKSVTSIRLLSSRVEAKTEEETKGANELLSKSSSGVNKDATAPVKKEDEEVKKATGSDSSTEDSSGEEENIAQSTTLSKSGPFSLLRQSFNQKTISSMLKFSSRASLRIKSSNSVENANATTVEKANAIAIAEANLMAAKQLKQQAQKLKEQQKREQQHLNSMVDPTSMMLAVQYNQHIQRQQQQQQQQQLMYQQAYAVAARGQMFDTSSVHLQHQMMLQRHQQQQQIASYMANLNSAHYMAQQMASVIPAPPMPHAHYLYPTPMATSHSQAATSSSVFRKSILKATGKAVAPQAPAQLMYHSGQQLIPMSVNHHSSLNIVYAGASADSTSAVSSSSTTHQQQLVQETSNNNRPLTKHSSLGASMRKTVKSILINRSSFLSSNDKQQNLANNHHKPPEIKLKSALKSSAASRELVLNSEGSDGDGSSSDSTTTANSNVDSSLTSSSSTSSRPTSIGGLPKSMLKKTHDQQLEISSDSSSSSVSIKDNDYLHSSYDVDKSTLTRSLANNFRHRIKVNSKDYLGKQQGQQHYSSVSELKAAKRKSIASTGRKNVTFSTKLTSVL